MTMKAIQWDKSKLTFGEVKKPELGERDVLVEVSHAGVCGSDLHVMENEVVIPREKVILGHEICGTIVEIGSNVTHIKPGQRVSVEVNSFCGFCSYCQIGKRNFCHDTFDKMIGIGADGGYAEFCSVPAKQAIPIPDSLPFRQAVLVEPMGCIIHSYELLAPIEDGSSILVMGAGIFGLLWCCMLHHRGFRDVTVTEMSDERLKIGKELDLGFSFCHPDDLKGGKKTFDIAVDCSGSTLAMEMAFGMLNGSGKLLLFGLTSPDAEIRLKPMDLVHKELVVIGSVLGPFCFAKSVKLVHEMADRYLAFPKLGIEIFRLDQYEKAFSKLRDRKISKAVFQLK